MTWQTTDLTTEAELAYRRERLVAELTRAHARRDERRARRAAARGRVPRWSLRARRPSSIRTTAAPGWSAVGER